MPQSHAWTEQDKVHILIDRADEHEGHTLVLEQIIKDGDRYTSETRAFCRTCETDIVLNTYEVKAI